MKRNALGRQRVGGRGMGFGDRQWNSKHDVQLQKTDQQDRNPLGLRERKDIVFKNGVCA